MNAVPVLPRYPEPVGTAGRDGDPAVTEVRHGHH